MNLKPPTFIVKCRCKTGASASRGMVALAIVDDKLGRIVAPVSQRRCSGRRCTGEVATFNTWTMINDASAATVGIFRRMETEVSAKIRGNPPIYTQFGALLGALNYSPLEKKYEKPGFLWKYWIPAREI